MSDDLSPDVELASAELDGILEGSARAPRSIVDALTAIRAELADVPSPTEESRELAIAAALAEFDRLLADPERPARRSKPVVVAAAPVDQLALVRAKQRRAYRWLGGAAAAAVVGVIGFSLANSNTGSDMKSSSTEAIDASKLPQDSDTRAGGEAPSVADSAPRPTIGGITGAGDPRFTTPDELRQYALASENNAPSATTPAADGTTAGTTPGTTAATAFSGTTPQIETTAIACDLAGGSIVGGPIVYIDRPAIVVVTDSVIRAVDIETCNILVEIDR